MRWTSRATRLRCEAVLVGGRVPIQWQEGLVRYTAWLDDLRRASSWVGFWETSSHLTLNHEPFLGRTLAELMEQIDRRAEGSEQTRFQLMGKSAEFRSEISPFPSRDLERKVDRSRPSSRWPSPTRPGIDTDKAPSSGPASAEQAKRLAVLSASGSEVDLLRRSWLSWAEYRSTCKQEMTESCDGSVAISAENDSAAVQQATRISEKTRIPHQIERQASRSLLSRLAGDNAPAEKPEKRGLPKNQRIRIISEQGAKFSLPVSRDVAAHQAWLHNLDRRTASFFRHLELEVLGVSNQASPFRSPLERHLLADQWALPLDGRPAPVGLLVHMANLSERRLAGFDDRHRLGSMSETPAVHLRDLDSASASSAKNSADQPIVTSLQGRTGPPTKSDSGSELEGGMEACTTSPETGQRRSGSAWPEPADPSGRPFASVLEKPQNAPGPQTWMTWLTGVASQISDVDREQERSARIDPPRAAPSMPPRLSSQERDVDVPSSRIAAATARYGAQKEAATEVEDDLSALATKIKRILDEEARRYGIDV